MTAESLKIDRIIVCHTIIPIIGDGVCLFWAILYLLYNTQVITREAREQISSHAVTNCEEFIILSHDSKGDTYPSAIEYFIDFSHPFTYTISCELEAVGQLYPSVSEILP